MYESISISLYAFAIKNYACSDFLRIFRSLILPLHNQKPQIEESTSYNKMSVWFVKVLFLQTQEMW